MQDDASIQSLPAKQSTCENPAGGACEGEKSAEVGKLRSDAGCRSDAEAGPGIDKNLLDACIHCGLCLPACPTYLVTGRESESPRGRIYLLNQWQTGEQGYSDRLAEHIDSCLGCLGCQTACPSGVNYERILSQARVALAKKRDWKLKIFLRFVFQQLLPDNKRLELFGAALRIWQKLKFREVLQSLAHVLPIAPLARLVALEANLPEIPPFIALANKSWAGGKKEGIVQFFSGCIMNIFYNNVNHSAVRVLLSQSQIVEVPEQTCCGALALHAGEKDIAQDLAKRNIEYFESKEGEIVVTSSGCAAMLKEYSDLFDKDDPWSERANAFSARVQDITEFLACHQFHEIAIRQASLPVESVAYHAACHLAHAQHIRRGPKKLLEELMLAVNKSEGQNKKDLTLVPLVDEEHCCGSAGIYNVLHPDMAGEVLAAKVANLKNTGAQVVVTTNPGCLLQLQAGVRLNGLNMRVCHLVELLDEAYCRQI
jgi:glycolate oxidase iron-sulfur subunit